MKGVGQVRDVSHP